MASPKLFDVQHKLNRLQNGMGGILHLVQHARSAASIPRFSKYIGLVVRTTTGNWLFKRPVWDKSRRYFMSQEELLEMASARFRPGMRVLVPDSGMLRCTSVYQVIRGALTGGLWLWVWFGDSLSPNIYELSWALKYVQVVPD
jgi:hypothetical protein